MRDKRDKFIELAEARVNRTINNLRLIGNLSNTRAYDFTAADVKLIFRTLQKELDFNRGRFSNTGTGSDTTFTLVR